MAIIDFYDRYSFDPSSSNFLSAVGNSNNTVLQSTTTQWSVRIASTGEIVLFLPAPGRTFVPGPTSQGPIPSLGIVGAIGVFDSAGNLLAGFEGLQTLNLQAADFINNPSRIVQGDDDFFGSTRVDVFNAGAGDDVLDGGGGEDVLNGGAGADIFYSNPSNETLNGGADNDLVAYFGLSSGVRVDLALTTAQFTGAGGFDTLSGIEGIVGTAFSDLLYGDGADNAILGGEADDLIEGRAGADLLSGDSGNDRLLGGDGNDLLAGGPGTDEVRGGAGVDMAFFDDGVSGVNADLVVGFAFGGIGADVLIEIEDMTGSTFSDILRGDANANTIAGFDGDDFIQARGGDDLLQGENGSDVLDGGEGNDTLEGGAGTDFVSYESSIGGVNVTLTSNATAGSTGTAFGSAGNDTLRGMEIVVGSPNSDIMRATTSLPSDTITLRGGAGDDRLTGQGAVVLEGGAGNDVMEGDNGFVAVSYVNAGNGVRVDLSVTFAQFTGDGFDAISNIRSLQGSNFSDILFTPNVNLPVGVLPPATLAGGLGDDLLVSYDQGDVLRGELDNDVLRGNGGNDTLVGGVGIDVIDGGAGTDTASYLEVASGVRVDLAIDAFQFTGAHGMDHLIAIETLLGSNFSDILLGGSVAESIAGNGGDDFLQGRGGADSLEGGAGNDVIEGGSGNDTLIGGDGNDTFVLRAGDGADVVRSYVDGQDRFQIAAPGISTFAQLTVATEGTGVRVSYGADSFLIENVALSAIGASDFIFGGG